MPATKRAAADDQNAPKSKRATTNAAKAEINSKISKVTDVLRDDGLMPTTISETVREMLARGAPHALNSFVEDRHETQTKLFGYIREVLSEGHDTVKLGLETAKAEVETTKSEVETCEAATKGDAEAVTAAGQAQSEQEDKVKAKSDDVKAAEKALKTIETENKTNEKAHTAHSKEKANLKKIEENGLDKLLSGGCAAGQEKKAVTQFIKDMQKLGADPSLLSSAPAVLLKSAEERQGFDDMVVNSLRTFLNDKVAAVDALLATDDANLQAHQARVDEKKAEIDAKKQALSAENEELTKLETTFTDVTTQQSDREKKLKALKIQLGEKEEAVTHASLRVEQVAAGLETLEALSLRSSEVPSEVLEPAADAAGNGDVAVAAA